jgi:prepilin peptidase CpaA
MTAASGRALGSAVLAAALAALALYPGFEHPLPGLGLGALFLFWVVQQDVARARIPNAVTLPAFVLALAHSAVLQGWRGLGWSVLGAALIFALLVLPFALGALGAGDVKALMVLAALFGPANAIGVLWWGTLLAGALAALLLLERRFWGALAARQLRFGAVLGAAVLAFRCWGAPW